MKQFSIRDAVQKDEIHILDVPMQTMAANILTKGLCEAKFTEHRENIMSRLNPNSGRVGVGVLTA